MGIYTRKKRRSGLRVIFYSTIIIFIVAFVSYFYLEQDMDYNLLNIQNQENKELENDIELIIIDGIGHRDFFPLADWFYYFSRKKVERIFKRWKFNSLSEQREFLKN